MRVSAGRDGGKAQVRRQRETRRKGRARAPLRRVDLTEPWPDDLDGVASERVTPTFGLIEAGQEIARMRGYPGDAFFWGLLDDMLAKLSGGAGARGEAI